MSNYVKSTNFAVKDALSTGDPAKKIVGTDIDTEFNNIATAVNSKANAASAALTGTPTAPTATAGTNTTQVATTAFVTGAITDSASSTETLTNKTLVAPALGTPASGVLTNCTGLPVAGGGTGAATLTANAVLTGNGTSAVGSVAPSTSGNVLTSNGTAWTSAAIPTQTQHVKAWVNFNGTTGAISASSNVSSITRTATGLYTINFTAALADANYAVAATAQYTASGANICHIRGSTTPTASAFELQNYNTLSGNIDSPITCVSVFR